MAEFLTRGQPAAVRHVSAMLASGLPHALLLVGPANVGKTTLALDIAAAQLCVNPDPAARPCRSCRGCRLVHDGNHADLHRLAPEGAGAMISIDAIRQLVADLSLLPMEGGARIALLEAAHRLTEDAQHALLKTLEEPPAGVTIILCAEDEDRLLPTIHSRVGRVRLGTVATRAIEELLEERGAADAPTAGRLARLVGGRPGLALAYAAAPDAVVARGELTRSLLDLRTESRALRLVRIRELLPRAAELADALQPASGAAAPARRTRGRRARPDAGTPGTPADRLDEQAAPADVPAADGPPSAAEAPAADGPATRASPAERRRSAAVLLDVWRDLARDLALVAVGEPAGMTVPDLYEELSATNATIRPSAIGSFLDRLDRAGRLLDANANPELLLDVLALRLAAIGPRSLSSP